MTEFKVLGGFEVKNAAKGEVEAVFATFDAIDHDGDVTVRGAFTDGAPVRISAYGHQSWKGALPVGRGTIHETTDGAVLRGRFFLDTSAGRDTFTVIRELGELQEWSYSLDDVKARQGEFDGRKVRFLERIHVDEVSPVLKGAGVNTRTLAMKNAGIDYDRLREIAASVRVHQERERFEQIEARHSLRMIRDRLARLELGASLNDAYFMEVGAGRVPEDVRAAAAAVVSLCTSHLKFKSEPQVRWYLPEGDQGRRVRESWPTDWEEAGGFVASENTIGLARRNRHTILLRADLAAAQAMKTAAHECRHLAQRPHGTAPDVIGAYISNEHDARDYADAFVAAYLDRSN